MEFNMMHLAELAKAIRQSVAVPGCYPVIGAEGDDWFIEISQGELMSRKILATLFVNVGEGTALPQVGSGVTEYHLAVPQAAHVLGFIGLLEKALGTRSAILHPLTMSGDYFPDWQPALDCLAI